MNLWGESGLPVLFLRHLGPVVKTPLQKGSAFYPWPGK